MEFFLQGNLWDTFYISSYRSKEREIDCRLEIVLVTLTAVEYYHRLEF